MLIDTKQAFALFENQTVENIQNPYEIFFEPIEEIKTLDLKSVPNCLRQVQMLSAKGYFLAGYIAYEAFSDLGELRELGEKSSLVHFWAFKKKEKFSAIEFEKNILPQLRMGSLASSVNSQPLIVYQFELNESFSSYQKKITKIKEYQRKGDTYQVNFTMKNRFKWQGGAIDFFIELKKYQKVSMAVFLHFDQDICSFSPELFIKKEGDRLISKPMKGTAPRGRDAAEDQIIVSQMKQDQKIISENLMIVDLIRNDFGRIALPGMVKVPSLFEVETYSTLHQMTSTVEAIIDEALTLEEIMLALFPCGSITGAPKSSTMRIIHELESEPRQIYTGAIGYILPNRDFVFNVAIRTLVLDYRINQKIHQNLLSDSIENFGEMGIGSGIIYESDIVKEWEECQLKAKFVKMINSSFQLIETFRYDLGLNEFLRIDLHLRRLGQSAEFFGFSLSLDAVEVELNYLRILLHSRVDLLCDQKIRLLLFQSGGIQLSYSPVVTTKTSLRVIVCKNSIKIKSILQRHKTTYRDFYEKFFKKAQEKGFDEVLFLNQDLNCVEASRHNLIVKKGERYLTPPLEDGALPGVFRQSLFLDQFFDLSEESIRYDELTSLDEIYLCNSVRGLVRAEISSDWLEEEF